MEFQKNSAFHQTKFDTPEVEEKERPKEETKTSAADQQDIEQAHHLLNDALIAFTTKDYEEVFRAVDEAQRLLYRNLR